MMQLFIQIPCFNEIESLPITLKDLPRHVEGFDDVKWLIIDDGSTDKTAEVAIANGVDYVIRFSSNQGLAAGFIAGLDACLKFGADVIVNTDADNQYCAKNIPDLVKPILEGHAEIVIGKRPISQIQHFSFSKKCLQHIGSWVVRQVSDTGITDAPSGFRAFSRDAALKLNVFNRYTYTLETIIQAGHKGITITEVPIGVNGDLRPSRLLKSISSYIKKSISTIIRIFIVYRPFKTFFLIGLALSLVGIGLGARYLFILYVGSGGAHIQSLILASIMIGMGFQTILIAFLADLMSVNRKIIEDIQYRVRKQEIEK